MRKAGSGRVKPRCRHHQDCSGCLWQHIPYDEQLRVKSDTLRTLLRAALGARCPPVQPTLAGAAAPWGHRHKVHFVFAAGPRGRGLVMGHYRRGSQAVVPVEECPVHAEAGNQFAFVVRDALRKADIEAATPDLRGGVVRHLVIRVAGPAPELLATLVVTDNARALRPAIRDILAGPLAPTGLHLNLHDRPGPLLFGSSTKRLAGADRVREEIDGLGYLVSPTAFFQTNLVAAAAMVRLVIEHTRGADRILDLYAGAGLFSLALAKRGASVTAVEENPQAVADGEASRRLNRISEASCRFVRARVEDVAAGASRRLVVTSPDAVVLDPPRQGCAAPVVDWIVRSLRPSRIVYVSCNPDTLAVDLKTLVDGNYGVSLVQPVDMFPHTPHIESVVVLRKKP
ncbi:MAG: 23S rRNA (uracil(1939)-C(5))-methyltransferase RlmD [Acidobacteria bacterium]|nr:23S rRNA (uracil(1939)-C(5))-methyltransferase RlmD [Acidobacteriota bacterium]